MLLLTLGLLPATATQSEEEALLDYEEEAAGEEEAAAAASAAASAAGTATKCVPNPVTRAHARFA